VTDDEGVTRSTLTREFQRAVEEHGVGYLALRQMVRNSIRYAFAEPALRIRLLSELDAALVRFESRWAAACPIPIEILCSPAPR
jgi:adenosine deaminase